MYKYFKIGILLCNWKKLLLVYTITLCALYSCSGSKLVKLPVGKIQTPHGDVYILLFTQTPNHFKSFISLANQGYWDSLTFNRVIPDFVIQGGCPDTPQGFNDPQYLLDPEFEDELTHVYGAVGAGRDDNPGKRSATCQFYIVQNKDGLHRLNGDYTVFGKVIAGMHIVEIIAAQATDAADAPLKPIPLKVEIVELTQPEIDALSQFNQ